MEQISFSSNLFNCPMKIKKWFHSRWIYFKYSELLMDCWFCGQNNIVKSEEIDKWKCRSCEQQNGFDESGDYVHPIPAQYNVTNQLPGGASTSVHTMQFLCESCARHQTLKVRQLAAYSPIDEELYEEEIERYKQYLEIVYRLCQNCEMKVYKHLRKQDTLLMDRMAEAGVQSSQHERDSDLLSYNQAFEPVENLSYYKQNWISSIAFSLCAVIALAVMFINLRLLSTSMSARIFSNNILQSFVDYIVQSISTKNAIDVVEVMEYLGTGICFVGMYLAGQECWYPEDAIHINLWVLNVVLANKDIISLVPSLAFRGIPHVLIGAFTLISAVVCSLRSRVPRIVNSGAFIRRPVSRKQQYSVKEKPLTVKEIRSGEKHVSFSHSELSDEEDVEDNQLIDNCLNNLNSFSLGSKKSTSSLFWNIPSNSKTLNISSSSSKSSLAASDSFSVDNISGDSQRPILSPSKLGFVSFNSSQTSNSNSSLMNNLSSPQDETEAQLPNSSHPIRKRSKHDKISANLKPIFSVATKKNQSVDKKDCKKSSCEGVQDNLLPKKTSFVSPGSGGTTNFPLRLVSPKLQEDENLAESVRRSRRIATKARPWPMKKAYSCNNAYGMDRVEFVGKLLKPFDRTLDERSSIMSDDHSSNEFGKLSQDFSDVGEEEESSLYTDNTKDVSFRQYFPDSSTC